MKSVLLSIKPKYCELIACSKKTIEVRKTRPKLKPPFKCYIYCSKGRYFGNSKVIGEFVCDFINEYTAEFVDDYCYEDIRQVFREPDGESGEVIITSNEDDDPNNCYLCTASCLSFGEIKEYIGVNFHEKPFYGWHISKLKIYDEPKELGEFYKIPTNCHRGIQKNNCDYCFDCQVTRPPQSWCYVEENNE